MWQLVKALGNVYTKLKSSNCFLRHQTPMGWPWEGEAHQPASSPAMEPSTPTQIKRGQESPETLVEHEEEYTDCLPAALLPTWPYIGSNWSWCNNCRTSPIWCMKRLRQMAIQRLNSFSRFETDMLNGWGVGNGSSSPGWALNLQQAWAYWGDVTHLWRFANSTLQDLKTWPQWV